MTTRINPRVPWGRIIVAARLEQTDQLEKTSDTVLPSQKPTHPPPPAAQLTVYNKQPFHLREFPVGLRGHWEAAGHG